jgi:hypothetical protein
MQWLQFWSDAHRETSVDVFVTEPFAFDEEYSRALVASLHEKISIRFVSSREDAGAGRKARSCGRLTQVPWNEFLDRIDREQANLETYLARGRLPRPLEQEHTERSRQKCERDLLFCSL